MRYRAGFVGAVVGGEVTRVAKLKIDLRVCWGREPCLVLAFYAAVRLRKEIRALVCVFILDIVLQIFSLYYMSLFFHVKLFSVYTSNRNISM